MLQQMDNHSYDDIINLPNPTSKNHPRMSLRDRAAQFRPVLLGLKNSSASKLLSNLVQAILLNWYPDTEKENTSLKVDEDMQQSRD